MKWMLVALAAVSYASAARLENNYLPPPGAASAGGGPGLAAPVNTYLPPGASRPGQGGYRPGGFGAGSGSYSGGAGSYSGGSGSYSGGGGGYSGGASYSGGAGSYSGGGGGFQQQGRPVAIIRQTNENNGDGTYTFSYETEDGTAAEESGQLKPDGAEGIQSAQGSFSFTAPDANRYTVTYTADENGFQPQGAHLPTPPPIPEAILKSLQANAADEARGIVDDGSYQQHAGSGGSGGYSQGGYQQGGYQQPSGGYNQNAGGYQQSSGGYQQNQYRPPSAPAGFAPSRRPQGFSPNSGYQY